LKTWGYDGGNDVHSSLGLSGEPIIAPVGAHFGDKPIKEFTASEIAAVNVAKRQYQKEYMDYWNSTASLTGTGRPVDAVIAPVAVFAAARPDMYDYYGESTLHRTEDSGSCVVSGYSIWVNVLDYTASVVPVTTVDKNIDVVDKDYKPLNEVDQKNYDRCKFTIKSGQYPVLTRTDDPEIFDGAHVSLQLVGRRLQEEKILALTEMIGDALGKHVV
jgi:amidase